jgi:hypothetical protein
LSLGSLTSVEDPRGVSLAPMAIKETPHSLILDLSLLYCYATIFSLSHSLPLSSLLSLLFIGVAIEELVAISCYKFFHLDNKGNALEDTRISRVVWARYMHIR